MMNRSVAEAIVPFFYNNLLSRKSLSFLLLLPLLTFLDDLSLLSTEAASEKVQEATRFISFRESSIFFEEEED